MDSHYLQPFETVGITPPRGRQGHSVPTPRPLGGLSMTQKMEDIPKDKQPLPQVICASDVPLAVTNLASPARFYSRRDHTFGGSASRLDRLRGHQDLPYMEIFSEMEEEDIGGGDVVEMDSGRPRSRNSVDLGSLGKDRKAHITLDRFTGDSLLHFSYNAGAGLLNPPEGQLSGSFVTAFNQSLNTSLNVPFVHQNPSPSPFGDSSFLFPSAARNPNKAIVTIDARTSRILIANEMTCELFGYQRNELVNMKVQSLFTEPYQAKNRALLEQNIDASGTTVFVSGKVMDAITSYGIEFPVSVWMKKMSMALQPRVIVVIEPVERSSAHFTMDNKGTLVSCDPWFACLFGYRDASEVVGKPVKDLIPSLQEGGRELSDTQAVTGRTKDETVFPLTVTFTDVLTQTMSSSMGDLTQTMSSSMGDLLATGESSGSDDTASFDRSRSDLGSGIDLDSSGRIRHAKLHRHRDLDHNASLNDSVLSRGETPMDVSEAVQNLTISGGESPRSPTNAGGEVPRSLLSAEKEEVPRSPSADGQPHPSRGEVPRSPPSADGQPHPLRDASHVDAKVEVYAALSGMISFLPDGTIHGCNHHFALMLFGYSQPELLKKDITFLIPDFYTHINYVDDRGIPLPPLDEECDEFLDWELFPSVSERRVSLDKVFEIKKPTGMWHTSPSHVRTSDTLRSPMKTSDTSPSHMKTSDTLRSPVRQSLSIPASRAGSGSTQHDSGMGSSFKFPLRPNSAPDSVSPAEDILDGRGTSYGESGASEGSTREKEARFKDSEITVPHFQLTDEGDKTPVISRKYGAVNVSGSTTSSLSTSVKRSNKEESPHQEGDSLPNDEPHGDKLSSNSTDQLLELLHARGLISSSEGHSSDGNKEPLSSTPASKSPFKRCQLRSDSLSGSHEFDRDSVSSLASLPEGTFMGEARHKDGSLLAIIMQLKCISLADCKRLFCVWISRDLEQDRTRTADLSMSMSRPPPDPYRNNIISPEVQTLTHSRRASDPTGTTKPSEEVLAMEGEYCQCYDTLRPVGKGAFGFVRMAQRKDDGLMVVVKFLRKSSVLKDCWVKDEVMGMVPLEIGLLARLSHPNIVTLLEAYENQHFFQMVMEKHGDGLDLFEFIDRNPKLSEPLISYMFRQIVDGLSYLHSQSILHRDIKDENIIVDHQFQLKLIDFGSAAYMEPGKVFNTFCGTLEYCSPEVLLGNCYLGPELEMWALGVTLYTLVFGENPFFDIEETISGHLQPPFFTSPALMKIILWLLHPSPTSRASLKDLQRNKWVTQPVDISQYDFNTVLGFARPNSGKLTAAAVNSEIENMDSNVKTLQAQCKHDE